MRLRTISLLFVCQFLAVRGQSPVLDMDFNAGNSSNEFLLSVAVQDDGRIIVAGRFTVFQGEPYVGLVRLMPDGSLDPSFTQVPLPAYAQINVVTVDSEGRVLFGGYFFDFEGTPISCIARLLETGARDPSFNPGTGANYEVRHIIVQSDGKILLGGPFVSINGVSRRGIARLNPDGSLDSDFDPGTGFSASFDPAYPYVRSLALDQEGRVVIGGSFDSFNGVATGSLVRLTPQAVLDGSFSPDLDPSSSEIADVLILPDQRIRIAGSFNGLNGQASGGIAGLLTDGATDPMFVQGPDIVQGVGHLVNDGDGMLLCGTFFTYQGIGRHRMARTDANGNLDLGFDVGVGFEGVLLYLNSLVLQTDGKILVAGNFEFYNGSERIDVVRLISTNPLVDCDGVPGGSALPGTMCDDLNPLTTSDTWTIDCVCSGLDCNGIQGGVALPGEPCDDQMPLTTNDSWTSSCECMGFDCLGIQGGNVLPGTPCDDLDPLTTNDVWSATCVCAGSPPAPDCLGVPGGTALPGTSCDDGIFFSTGDSWTSDCDCSGFDCAGSQGGNALPGAPCDDGISWTYNDVWNASCLCAGTGMVSIAEGTTTGLEPFLWPNPAKSGGAQLWLKLPAFTTARVEVMDASGRVHWSQQVTAHGNNPVELRTSGLSAGIHMVSVVSEHGSYVRRLVVH